MKTIFALLSLVSVQFMYSQRIHSERINTGFNKNGSIELKAPTKGELEGSMYIYEEFSAIKAGGELQPFLGRYNAFKDKMEFKDKDKIYEYFPSVGDKDIIIINLNKTYVYVNYYIDDKKDENGYLVKLQSGENIALYKKEKIKFKEGRISQTGYDKTVPDKYIKENDAYYIKVKDGNIMKLPNSKKQFAKMFIEKEKDILKFIKDNSYSLNEEAHLNQILYFINK